MTDVAVIGSGKVGGTLARSLSRAGLRITIGARDPEKADVVDGLLTVWLTLVRERQLGRRLALKMLREA